MQPDSLENRVKRLEFSNRRMRHLLLTIFFVSPIVIFLGAGHTSWCEHRANRFVLVDICGNERATLEFENGEPVLKMIGSSSTTQVKLGITEVHSDSASLYLQNATATSFLSLGATATQSSSTIEFGGGLKRINLRTNLPGDNPNIRVTDEAGVETLNLPESK